MAGIYLHIPFCRQACHYCDFHFSVSLKNKNAVLKAIEKEIIINAGFLDGEKIETIYFGGGSPSILSTLEISSLLKVIDKEFDLDQPEICLEANPDDLNKEKISDLKNAGINRLSIGVQSFHDKDLELMNRAHNSKMARNSIETALQVGIEDITIDLIYGIPKSNMSEWRDNLSTFLSYNLSHLSAYSLTYEDRTAFGNWLKKGSLTALNEEEVIEEFSALMATMNAHGYEHYEISNFCLPGKRSKHNTSYWLGESYLGIGPSAHSYNGKIRKWNAANNSKYTKGINAGVDVHEMEVLTERDKLNEYILTNLRAIWGLDLKEVEKRFGVNQAEALLNESKCFIEKSQMKRDDSVLVLTEKGKLVADKITSDLFVV